MVATWTVMVVMMMVVMWAVMVVMMMVVNSPPSPRSSPQL